MCVCVCVFVCLLFSWREKNYKITRCCVERRSGHQSEVIPPFEFNTKLAKLESLDHVSTQHQSNTLWLAIRYFSLGTVIYFSFFAYFTFSVLEKRLGITNWIVNSSMFKASIFLLGNYIHFLLCKCFLLIEIFKF